MLGGAGLLVAVLLYVRTAACGCGVRGRLLMILSCFSSFCGLRRPCVVADAAPGNFARSIYRTGESADCSVFWNNFKNCKRMSDASERERILETERAAYLAHHILPMRPLSQRPPPKFMCNLYADRAALGDGALAGAGAGGDEGAS